MWNEWSADASKKRREDAGHRPVTVLNPFKQFAEYRFDGRIASRNSLFSALGIEFGLRYQSSNVVLHGYYT